ncbi:hypothetical protein G9464_20755 [Halostella sp. JP-L12]|uniref:hypothetical protein n=1 Tax=Halostella TaxID=1843185 RepID=UPI000EF82836|nr:MULTISPECIES: hypothetical protein [Halostella]NHN50002.1 hypothetical protein [Halostella sp. JP-L12]
MSGTERLPPYAEPIDKDDECRWVRCTVCGNEAPNLSLLEHDCIYSNDLVADGGTEITSTEQSGVEAYEEKMDELWEGLLQAYTAGYKKAMRDFEVTDEIEKYEDSEFIKDSHYHYWDGRTLPLEFWLREQFDVNDGGEP